MYTPYDWTFTIHVYDDTDYFFENEKRDTVTLTIPASAGTADEVLEKAQLAVIRSGMHDGYRLSVTVGVDEHGASGVTREIVLIVAAWSFGRLADPLWDRLQAWVRAEYEMSKDAPNLHLLSPEQKAEYYEGTLKTRYQVDGDLELVKREVEDIVIFKDGNGMYYKVTPVSAGAGITIETSADPL